MKKRAKNLLKRIAAVVMVMALCLPFLTACDGADEGGKKPMKLTDGYFEATSEGLTWTCVFKESGIYYFQSITGAVAGTWEEVEEEIQYISNYADEEGKDDTVPNKENPEYKTADRCVILTQFNGETQKVAYAEGRLWSVSADFGLSTRNLTQKDAVWDETSERSVTVVEFYEEKDSAKLVQLTHNFEFRDSINGISGTWEKGTDEGSYILSADGKTGSLTVAEDGMTADYTLGESTVTLYKTSLSPVYEFTSTTNVTLAGDTEPSAIDFSLALYNNGDGKKFDGDADFTFYDKDYNMVTVDSGRYTYDKEEKKFTFSGFKNKANNGTVDAKAGEFTFTFTDAQENGAFEKVNDSPATIAVTYKQPPIYTMRAELPDGSDCFASVEMFENGGDAGSVKLTKLTLEVLESGEVYIRSKLELGETLSAAVGGIQSVTGTLAEGTVKEKYGNILTIDFGGATIKTQIDKENKQVNADAFSVSDIPIGMGSPIEAVTGDKTVSLSNIVFSTNYKPAAVYEFKPIGAATYSNVKPEDGFMPSAVLISAMDDGSYQIAHTFQETTQVAQTGTWKLSADGSHIEFTKTDAAAVTFTAEKLGSDYQIKLEALEIGTGVDLPADYGTLTADFVCKGQRTLLATLSGEKSLLGSLGSLSAMNGAITGDVKELSLLLYADGTVDLQATVSFAMLASVGNIPGGIIDKGTYAVDGGIYTFVFEGAGEITGTLTDNTLRLEYAPASTAAIVYTAPEIVAQYFEAAGEITVSGVNCTFSGTVE